MNIEAYDADSLRKIVRLLEYENKILKDNQWVDELNHFLEIREEPPEYETKTGRKKGIV